MTSLQR